MSDIENSVITSDVIKSFDRMRLCSESQKSPVLTRMFSYFNANILCLNMTLYIYLICMCVSFCNMTHYTALSRWTKSEYFMSEHLTILHIFT